MDNIYNKLGKNLPYHPSKQADGDKPTSTIVSEGKKQAELKIFSQPENNRTP